MRSEVSTAATPTAFRSREGAIGLVSTPELADYQPTLEDLDRETRRGLFVCNRWVTGETWYPAEDVIRMLDRFVIDHAWPSWPTNRRISAMLRLYRPWIERLLWHRDAVIAAHLNARPTDDVFEDRTLEITGLLPISVDRLLAALAESS